ncbi:MAG: transporter substrate-binding domain-containing protein, partial [Myxococcales bacterium]|nr:transporter substrate-binding domain-containing protein [Myxococcales bacterium]
PAVTNFGRGLAFFAAALLSACTADRELPDALLRIGTSADYRPFSFRDEAGALSGLDMALVRAYAADRGLATEFVPFRWSELLADMQSGRFDLAVGGLTVRPERSIAGHFSVPLLESGAVLLIGAEVDANDEAAVRAARLRIGVNAGGHLERVVRRLFPNNPIETFGDNAEVPRALRERRIDAAMTDTLEAPHWSAENPGCREIGPLTRDFKAWWVSPTRAALAADINRWLLAREADGSLARYRERWLDGTRAPRSAGALPALMAAVRERLALMEAVAHAKRAADIPTRVPAREAELLAIAREGARNEARRGGFEAPDDKLLDAFFRGLFGAARDLQDRVSEGEPAGPVFDLDRELRPALTRISEKIAMLIVRLPRGASAGLEGPALRSWVGAQLQPLGLTDARSREIADGLIALLRRQPLSSSRIDRRWASSAGAGVRSSGSGKPEIFTGFPAILSPPARITMLRART